MAEGLQATLLLVAFLGLLALRVPVAFSLGLTAFGWFLAAGVPPLTVVQKMAVQMGNTTLAAIPFFILCGEIMSAGGMARRLVDLASACIGFVRGGLAMVNILASMLFGGISGSSVADTSSLGSILIPMMVRKGYHRDYSVAVTVTSSTQGIVIPPSHNAILYSLAAGGAASVQDLFLAGYLPGAAIAVSLMGVAWWIARRRGYPKEERVPPARAAGILVGALPALATPAIIIVPIVTGTLPAHQAAGVAVLWAALVSTFVYRGLPLSEYPRVLVATGRTSGMVMILIGTAAALGEALTYLHVPAHLTAALTSLTDDRVLLLLAINGLLLALGLVMDMAPLIVLLTPLLLPVVVSLGMDPVQFGIVLLVNLGIGLLTPPVGATLFVGCAIGGISIGEATRALVPFWLALVAVLLAVTFVAGMTGWLPHLVETWGQG